MVMLLLKRRYKIIVLCILLILVFDEWVVVWKELGCCDGDVVFG